MEEVHPDTDSRIEMSAREGHSDRKSKVEKAAIKVFVSGIEDAIADGVLVSAHTCSVCENEHAQRLEDED